MARSKLIPQRTNALFVPLVSAIHPSTTPLRICPIIVITVKIPTADSERSNRVMAATVKNATAEKLTVSNADATRNLRKR
jgi:hypothetical protein